MTRDGPLPRFRTLPSSARRTAVFFARFLSNLVISISRGGEFPYRFQSQKRQALCRGGTNEIS